jgi:hypothetical protein
MCVTYVIIALVIVLVAVIVYNQIYSPQEGFYPRRWHWGPSWRWGWRRPYPYGWGNWRPFGYYPAYSGYWKQCPHGTWCPITMSCESLGCM